MAQIDPEMCDAAMRRPKNYHRLPESEQWSIDKDLGILDWDGEMTNEQIDTYWKTHLKP